MRKRMVPGTGELFLSVQLLTREQSPSFVAAVPMRAQCGWEASIGPAGAL